MDNFGTFDQLSQVLSVQESSNPNICTDNIWVSPDDIDVDNDNTSIPPISVTLAPSFDPGSEKILVLHRNLQLKLFCENLTICYGIKRKFVDHAGRPLLNFMVYASEKLGSILMRCDSLAQKLSAGCGSKSDWRSVVKKTKDFCNYPIVRLNLPFVEEGDIPRLATEIYHKDACVENPVVISSFEATELNPLLTKGKLVDAYFTVNTYDYKQKAGIRLVVDKLIVYY